MIPDKVCAQYADKKGMKKIAVQVFKDEDGADWVLLEGESDALEFLGNVFFTKNSIQVIYINRIPCIDDSDNKMAKP